MKKKKILMLSDSPTTATGYATITRKILNGLSDEFECHCLAHNYIGQTLKPPIHFIDNDKINFHLHGASGRGKYTMDKITPIIRKYEIDVFGILLDTFMLYPEFAQIDTSPAKTFFYYPTDGGGGLPINCENILKKVHLPIAMSKFGKDQIKKVHNINSMYIPHAFDENYFFPLPEEDKIKNRLKWKFQNKFIVGSVARNQGRKMLDLTIKIFRVFCNDKPDAMLLLHIDPNDSAQVFNLSKLINDLKLNNRVIFTGTTFFNPFTYSEMNEIYNLMDVFMLSTSGEGFGIPTIEAMACGVPQVVTGYTTTQELIIDGIQTGEEINLCGNNDSVDYPYIDLLHDGQITGNWNVERGIASIKDGVYKLNKLYKDRELLKKYSNNSIIKSKDYTWNKVIPIWKETIKELIKNE